MNFDLLEFIRARYKAIVPILIAVLLVIGYMAYRSSLQVGVSQPLAAEPTPVETCPDGEPRSTIPPDNIISLPVKLRYQCLSTSNTVVWPDVSQYYARRNVLQRSVDGGDWQVVFHYDLYNHCRWLHSNGYVDLDVQPGHTYEYRHMIANGVYSDVVTCPATSPTPAPPSVSGAGMCPRPSYAICGKQYEELQRLGDTDLTGNGCCGLAYNLRFGHANYDPESGLFWGITTGSKWEDHKTWAWTTAPPLGDVNAWKRGSTFKATSHTPPAERPSRDAWEIRCFYSYYLYTQGKATWYDVTGGLDFDAYPACHLCPGENGVCDPGGMEFPPVYKWKPTPSPIPTPVTEPYTPGGSGDLGTIPTTPLYCDPTNQTISLSDWAFVGAAGGNETYQWNFSGGGVLEDGGAAFVQVSYSTPGTKTLIVNSAGQTARCTVNVSVTGTTSTATPTASPTFTIAPAITPGTGPAAITITKSARNISVGGVGEYPAISVSSGQIADFTIDITNIGGQDTSGLVVRDEVPFGMSYLSGSTRVEGQAVPFESVTTSGLILNRLEPADTVTIQWSAVADVTDQISGNSRESFPRAVANADGIADSAAEVGVTVYKTGTIAGGTTGSTTSGTTGETQAGAASVATGPGSAVTIALIVAAMLTLLYSAYTRSPMYRRREAKKISGDQDPLDFRS